MSRNARFCSSLHGTAASSSVRVLPYSARRNGASAAVIGRSRIAPTTDAIRLDEKNQVIKTDRVTVGSNENAVAVRPDAIGRAELRHMNAAPVRQLFRVLLPQSDEVEPSAKRNGAAEVEDR